LPRSEEELRRLSGEYEKFAKVIEPRLKEFNGLVRALRKNPSLLKLQELGRSLIKDVCNSKFSKDIAKNMTVSFIETIEYEALQWNISLFTTMSVVQKRGQRDIPLLKAEGYGEEVEIKLVPRAIILDALPDC